MRTQSNPPNTQAFGQRPNGYENKAGSERTSRSNKIAPSIATMYNTDKRETAIFVPSKPRGHLEKYFREVVPGMEFAKHVFQRLEPEKKPEPTFWNLFF